MLQKINELSGKIIILVLALGFVYFSRLPYTEGLLIAILAVIIFCKK